MKNVRFLVVILVALVWFKVDVSFAENIFKANNETKKVLTKISSYLSKPASEEAMQKDLSVLISNSNLPKNTYGAAIVLYQPKQTRLLVLRRGKNLAETLSKTIASTRAHKRFSKFNLNDKNFSRIQVDILTNKPTDFDMTVASMDSLDSSRFEFGVDGLIVTNDKEWKYLLPGDAFVKSKLGFNQLDRGIRKNFNIKNDVPLKYKKFRTISFINYLEDWLELYRGYPYPWQITKKDIEQAAVKGGEHLVKYQKANGKFLYYYDAESDSILDHEHPNRDPEKNGYYNIIRHFISIPILTRMYDHTKDNSLFDRMEQSLNFANKYVKKYTLPDGQTAAHLYQYKKSKLGAAGTFLFALAEYKKLTHSKKFDALMKEVALHLMNEINSDGEFRYYQIYHDKEVTWQENFKFFDFYYPGEALLGLAGYLKINTDPNFNSLIKQKISLALNFLLNKRVEKYKDLFPSLPMDAWLMMSINELWDIPEFQKTEYKNFVYDQARLIMKQAYTINDALYPDYPGSYYYTHGNHAYPDGARAEGIMAAIKLTTKLKDDKFKSELIDSLHLTLRAMYFLVNTEKSVYSTPNPAKSIGGVRFKLTRQWFRIDTIGHVINVYFDFLPYWDDAKDRKNSDLIKGKFT